MLKTHNTMEKGCLLILIVLFVIPFTSAEVEYIQNKLFIFGEGIFGYSTILNSAFLRYDKSESDFVANNNPLEVSVNFRTYLQKWNNSTESLDVDWCNIAVIYVNSLSDNVTVLYNRTFYPNESDIDSDDFFVKLQDKDIMRTVASCHFVNVQTLNPLYDLDMPLDFNLNTPTWECKACQFYEWEQRIRDVDKAVLLGDNTHTV